MAQEVSGLDDKFVVAQTDAEWATARKLVLTRSVLIANYPILKSLLEDPGLGQISWTVSAYSVSITRQW